MGTVNAWVDRGIELEFHSQLLYCEFLHLENFMAIDLGSHSFQLERKSTVKEQTYASHAAVKASRQPRQCFIRFSRATVKRDLNSKRRIFAQVVGDSFIDQDAIREKSDQEALFLREGVNFKKIFPRKDLAPGEQKPDHAQISHFGKNFFVLFLGQFPLACSQIAHREIVVAMLANEGTTASYFE